MLGQVSTQMYVNKTPFQLPEGSPYEPIAEIIARQSRGELNLNNESPDVTASNLVKDTMGGRRGQIWRGGLAGSVYLGLWLLPTKLFEWVVHLKRGVYNL